jgi:hypothetical protein
MPVPKSTSVPGSGVAEGTFLSFFFTLKPELMGLYAIL